MMYLNALRKDPFLVPENVCSYQCEQNKVRFPNGRFSQRLAPHIETRTSKSVDLACTNPGTVSKYTPLNVTVNVSLIPLKGSASIIHYQDVLGMKCSF